MDKVYQVPEALMNRIYNTLQGYANESSYRPPRIGGVVAGCPREPAPTPTQLAMNARFMLREIDRDLLGRSTNDASANAATTPVRTSLTGDHEITSGLR